jgi:hypothetical protein
MFVNGLGRNEQSLQRTFHGCFLLRLAKRFQGRLFRNRRIRNHNYMWQLCLLTHREKWAILIEKNRHLVGSTYERFCIFFLKTDWKVSDTGSAHCASSFFWPLYSVSFRISHYSLKYILVTFKNLYAIFQWNIKTFKLLLTFLLKLEAWYGSRVDTRDDMENFMS